MWLRGVYIQAERLLVAIGAVDDIERAVTDAEGSVTAENEDSLSCPAAMSRDCRKGGIVSHPMMLHVCMGLSTVRLLSIDPNHILRASRFRTPIISIGYVVTTLTAERRITCTVVILMVARRIVCLAYHAMVSLIRIAAPVIPFLGGFQSRGLS